MLYASPRHHFEQNGVSVMHVILFTHQNIYSVSGPRHYNDPDVILCHNLVTEQ